MRTVPRRLQALVMTAALAGCAPAAASHAPMPDGGSAPAAHLPELSEPVAGEGMVEDVGTVVRPVQPKWTPGSGGIGMSDEWGEHPVILEPPVEVSVLAGPLGVDGGEWYQVYVLPDAMRWPSDFVAWVPAEQDGASVLEVGEPAPCPEATAGHLAALTPKARAGCFDDRVLTFVARSWIVGHWVPYETEPDWLGTTVGDVRSVSLYESDGEFPRPPDPRVEWLDARVPPDLEMPPAGMTLLVEGRFDDPQARGCGRTRDRSGPPRQPPTAGLPDEGPEASETWCRGQFVLRSWEIILGPEGRPPVVGEVQLHRTTFEGGECAGVGMSLLRFHMDITAPDPIWLEAEGQPGRAIPVFGRGFRAETEPELHIVGPRGEVVARHGTILDPDQPLGPYAVCPMAETVSITGT